MEPPQHPEVNLNLESSRSSLEAMKESGKQRARAEGGCAGEVGSLQSPRARTLLGRSRHGAKGSSGPVSRWAPPHTPIRVVDSGRKGCLV